MDLHCENMKRFVLSLKIAFLELGTSHRIDGIENVNTTEEQRSKIARNRVFNCHLSPDWRQMAIKNTVL